MPNTGLHLEVGSASCKQRYPIELSVMIETFLSALSNRAVTKPHMANVTEELNF